MATRVERWEVGGETLYKVVGIMWGGYQPTSALAFRTDELALTPVDVCPPQRQNSLWTVFQHPWRPTATGTHYLGYEIEDDAIPTRRLDSGYYDRPVVIDAV